MGVPFWYAARVAAEILDESGTTFHDYNDLGFEESLRERKAPKRAFGLPQLFAGLEKKLALAEKLDAAALASGDLVFLADVVTRAAATAAAKTGRAKPEAIDVYLGRAVEAYQAWEENERDHDAIDRAHVAIASALSVEGGDKDVNVWMFAGNVLRARRRGGEAIGAYRRGIAVEPRAHQLLYNLGLALEDADQRDEAAEAYERFIAAAAEEFPDAVDDAKARRARLRKKPRRR